MARYKGAVGYEIGTSKLGAYSMEDTLDIFEREGYVKYKDLDQYFKDCYFDFENKLSEKEFIEKSKKNILRSHKYKQFMNNEVKMCSKCRAVKPFDDFYDISSNREGKRCICKLCNIEIRKKEASKNRARENKYAKTYREKNKEKIKEINALWIKNNKKRYDFIKRKVYFRKVLKKMGYSESALVNEKLDILMRLKEENGIFKYSELLEKFGSVLDG